MSSSWIRTSRTTAGEPRYRVYYRLGGRVSASRYAGTFKRKAEAEARRRWVMGEIAARRVPDLGSLETAKPGSLTFEVTARKWLASRIDVSEGTKIQNRTSVNRAILLIGDRPADELTPQDIASMVSDLHAAGVKKGYLRKVLQATAMTLDFAGRYLDNPVRDKRFVKLPHEDPEEFNPPTANHVMAAHDLMPSRYRLPLLVLEDTGMRIGEIERLEWRDLDEPQGRWRIRKSVSKTSRARWVTPDAAIFTAVIDLCPREDRQPSHQVFDGFSSSAFRTQLGRVCTAAAIPSFSPHDLRHRRISMMLRKGVDPVTVARRVGHTRASMSLDVYGHVLVDDIELDYEKLLGAARGVLPSVRHTERETLD